MPVRHSCVAPMPRLAGTPTRPPRAHTPHPPRVPAAGTPPYGSTCYSDGHLEVAYDPYNGIYYYPGCTKLGGCDESWSVSPHPAFCAVPLPLRSITAACLPAATEVVTPAVIWDHGDLATPVATTAATPTATERPACPATPAPSK
eukprot:scaffold39118_cov52-Phaeocystis_antarctica.AAC.1